MSVIVEDAGHDYLYVKGSPEVISKLCTKIPETYQYILNKYASQVNNNFYNRV